MAEDTEIENTEETEGEGLEEEEKSFSSKKLIIFVILPLLLLGGGGTGLYVSGMLDGVLGKPSAEEGEHAGEDGHSDSEEEHGYDAESKEPGYFFQMEEMVVNLDPSNRRARFLKLTVALELNDEKDAQKIETVLPRVVDHFQTYLRELRLSDLQGSAGVYRLRQELLARVQAAAEDVEIRDVLFKEILIQ